MNKEWENVYSAVSVEAEEAQAKFGDFASMHEAWGVLAEEVEEFAMAVRLKQSHPRRSVCIQHEAIQIAAVAMRIAEQALRVTR